MKIPAKKLAAIMLCIALLLLCSCARNRARSIASAEPKKKEQQLSRSPSDYRVTVQANGMAVNDFNRQLVHRYSLPKEVAEGLKNGNGAPALPFSTKPEKDQFGKVTGLRISNLKGAAAADTSLGLENNDLVTAVGKKLATSAADFRIIHEDLAKNQEGSLTVMRKGSPHKILFTPPS